MTFDRAYGVLLGQAIGDALGIPAEHKTREWCQERYKKGGPHTFERVERPSRNEVFEAGEWSDDTDQAFILVDSWLAHGRVHPQDVARRLVDWTATQKGLGSHTRAVLAEPDFLADPATAALRVWELGDRQAAPNGAVMRSAVVGLFSPDFDEVWGMAMAYSRITHADPRCQISAAMVAGLVHLLARGEDINFSIEAVKAKQRHDPIGRYVIDEHVFDWDGPSQGYTFKPVQAAIRALRLLDELRPGQDDMLTVVPLLLARQIREGGDTDTNAAVAGAVLGAYAGASAFILLRGGLLRLDAVRERAARLTGSEE